MRDVDFGNRVWRNTCLGSVQTRGGEYERRFEDYGRASFGVGAPLFGDLDGDGVEEAIVPTECNGGGSGRFSDATIFTWSHGRLREVTRLGEGDRADGGLGEVRIEGDAIVEERYATEHGALDFEYIVTHRRALRGGRLVEIAAATVACDPERNPGCTLPSTRPSGVRFEAGRVDGLRMLPLGPDGQPPALTLHLRAGQEFSVSAWCEGTTPASLRVEPPTGPAVEARDVEEGLRLWTTSAGRHRVVLRVRRPVGLCWALLGAR